jgi:hypothetical protein
VFSCLGHAQDFQVLVRGFSLCALVSALQQLLVCRSDLVKVFVFSCVDLSSRPRFILAPVSGRAGAPVSSRFCLRVGWLLVLDFSAHATVFSCRTAQISSPLDFHRLGFWSVREGLRPLLFLFHRRRSDLSQLRFSLGLMLDCSCSWVKGTSQLRSKRPVCSPLFFIALPQDCVFRLSLLVTQAPHARSWFRAWIFIRLSVCCRIQSSELRSRH